ncbi:MAG: hypothetical protein KAT90_03185 [Gammaproteobacteria bacterium]|nr:hypothetical protein [Gammaproteobacteria bacterium]
MKLFNILLSAALYILCLPSASATSLLPVSLEQLSTRASIIFYGTVINNQVKKDTQSGHIATFTEFEIIDLIKGNIKTSNYTIKQIGGHLKESKTVLRIHGVPKYQMGNKYVVFLPEKSSLGFSSPLGLHQGSFPVSSINGEQVISNGQGLSSPLQTINNNAVQIPLAVNNNKPSQARLTDFINTVRAYNTP